MMIVYKRREKRCAKGLQDGFGHGKCPAENQLEQGAASFKMSSAASGTNGGFVDAVGFDVGVDLRTFDVKQ